MTSKSTSRVVIIADADRMTTEAQNALLKTLEEPPEGTCIVLTAKSDKSLLPTISSRTRVIDVLPVTQGSAADYFKDHSDVDISRNYALSRGNVGLLAGLLDNTEHSLKDAVGTAKEILSSKMEVRLGLVDNLVKDKENMLSVIDAIKRIAHAGINSSSKLNNKKQTLKWHATLKYSQEALESLSKNANAKLVVDKLFFNI